MVIENSFAISFEYRFGGHFEIVSVISSTAAAC